MKTAALLGPYYADTVLDWENGQSITSGRFLSDVEALADLLPDTPMVTNLAEDLYRFLVGFSAALVRGQTTLLPPTRAPGALAQIVQEYRTGYCLVDGTEQVEQLPSYQIPKSKWNPTFTAKIPHIPIDHPAVVAFASGSTESPHAQFQNLGLLSRSRSEYANPVEAHDFRSNDRGGDSSPPAHVRTRSLRYAPL